MYSMKMCLREKRKISTKGYKILVKEGKPSPKLLEVKE
jgi:hypothetical protein